MDVLSALEAVLDTPAAVTNAQVQRMKRRAMARMKEDGVEFDGRVSRLGRDGLPQAPRRGASRTHYEGFLRRHPYVFGETVKPKAIAREMYELGYDFNKYVTHHGLNRSEGSVLRYLTSVQISGAERAREPQV